MVQLAKKQRGRRRFRRGHAPYLGRIRLHWCDTCNLPRISENECSVCDTKSRKVEISPPGDPFPAMDGHLSHAINTLDRQFGQGVGIHLLPSTKPIVLNKVSAIDAMYEIIVDGHILGRLRFEIPESHYTFVPTLEGGRRIGEVSSRKWILCHDEVLKYLKDGANLMLPGVADFDSNVEVDDEVWVKNSEGSVIAVGKARMSGKQMEASEKGFAVKIREVSDPASSKTTAKESTWDTVVDANSEDLDRIEDEAMAFIRRTVNHEDSSVVVGFSGGKDSLVTYLLVEKSLGFSPSIFFIDTGIELPETIVYVRRFAEERNVKVLGEKAGDAFWDSIDTFGPPARDFRWCCKVLKLGPAATSIAEELGGKVLSFMGQRKLESFQRSIEPRVSHNPWVPGQVSANPIQNWNALEVWLYTFREGAEFNPLYNQGYHRIGCYLCPSSPLAELNSLRITHPKLYDKWYDTLQEWRRRYGYPEEWIGLGFWRWKRLPKGQMDVINRLGLDIGVIRRAPEEDLKLTVVKGVSPCVSSGFSLEGQFDSGINIDRAAMLMPIFGDMKVSEEMGALRVTTNGNSISLFSSGSLTVRGEKDDTISTTASQIERALKRALFCQACGSCVPQCENGALTLEKGAISVDPERCTNCLECDNWPCPTYLR
ncbi:MAG: phosphoadenosine phosphosulfate reductase family protein [Candidatus Thorarchaeota archaeon]|nr:MAG: phosphoadenosine phosphosulfate reductase family protein [Candidatus Thorarchaeota archaeon]